MRPKFRVNFSKSIPVFTFYVFSIDFILTLLYRKSRVLEACLPFEQKIHSRFLYLAVSSNYVIRFRFLLCLWMCSSLPGVTYHVSVRVQVTFWEDFLGSVWKWDYILLVQWLLPLPTSWITVVREPPLLNRKFRIK